MVKVTAQGTLVLPIVRIKELLKTVDTGNNKFHQARDTVLGRTRETGKEFTLDLIEFSVSGNRVHVTCVVTGNDYKNLRKQSFDIVYEVISELMTLILKIADIENDDTLMSVKDIEIVSTEN